MASRAPPIRLLDRFAIGLSGLCLVHCVATTVLVAALSSAGGLLGSPLIHEIGLAIAMGVGAVALGRGFAEHRLALPGAVGTVGLALMGSALTLPHGGAEAAATMAGVLILALGHRLNGIAAE